MLIITTNNNQKLITISILCTNWTLSNPNPHPNPNRSINDSFLLLTEPHLYVQVGLGIIDIIYIQDLSPDIYISDHNIINLSNMNV